MKILFVVKTKKMETLGPMYLSAIAKKFNHKTKICSLDESQSVAHSWMPDIIGFSCLTGDQKKMIKANSVIMNKWPKTNQKPITMFGGPHPTFFPQDFDNDDNIHCVVKGEAEDWFEGILGGKEHTEYANDLDSLPWPDRSSFQNMKIRDFIASRGCPGSCSYCYNEKWFKLFKNVPRVRTRAPEHVVSEIDSVSPAFAYFQDSCFGVDMKWMRTFSSLYRKTLGMLPYHCHLRPDQINEERVRLLADSGCESIRIALETANKKLRKMLGRGNISLDMVRKGVDLLHRYGIKVMVQNMVGLPHSELEHDLETLEFNIQMNPDYSWCSIYTPYPGTRLGDLCVKDGLFDGDYGKVPDSFFERSVLKLSNTDHSYYLQKVFQLCVEAQYVPKANELTSDNFPMLIHSIERLKGDRKLYPGIF